ncbi:MAG: glycosyltransferase family 39 protein [Bradyrhizobiaceae bacterium]|nr:MAG: glycosyltransferase family 39 protein [Bradyrhizobiaceae bacterium]
MRFTSLIVELLRARPRLIFWVASLCLAAIWFLLPTLLYTSPPGNLAAELAFGREYQVGTVMGPPLSFWLADIAFRLAGGHMFGVYFLSQICFIVTAWAVFTLARAIVGKQQAIIAALLTLTITALSYQGIEFGPLILARPLWALTLLHSWRVMGEGRRTAWFLLSFEIGLLFLTLQSAPLLVAILIAFALATSQGRKALASLDPLFCALVVLVIALPYYLWLLRTGATLPRPPMQGAALDKLRHWGNLLGWLALPVSGIALLVIVNLRRFNRNPEQAPVIYRPPLTPFARSFVYTLALAPPLLLSLLAALYDLDDVVAGQGAVLLLAGLAVVVAAGDLIFLRRQEVLRMVWLLVVMAPVAIALAGVFVLPWTGGGEVRTLLPAADMAKFFDVIYRARTGRPLQIVAGDPQLAALLGYGSMGRPQVFYDFAPRQTPWVTFDAVNRNGALVVWRATDTVGAPPPGIAQRFPGLMPEVPRTFDRPIAGRQEPFRIGWAILRPASAK